MSAAHPQSAQVACAMCNVLHIVHWAWQSHFVDQILSHSEDRLVMYAAVIIIILPTMILRSSITKTSPCNEDPLTSHVYIVKLGFTGVCIFFIIFAPKHS